MNTADTAATATTPGPLSGVRVLDMSVMISGPLAAMMLADQGADVIKVESPGLGDIMRFLGSNKGGLSGIFANNNRGKRSIVVDLKHAAGVDIVKRLAAQSDVLVQNFRPGAMERLGLGYDDLAAINPDLIYVSVSGYGPDGPYSHRRVYDNVIQAASGIASVQTDPATGVPSLYRTLVCDKVTSYTAAQAITAALYARATGAARGQHIVLAMLDAAIAFMWPDSAMDAVLLDSDASRAPTIGSNYMVTTLKDGYAAASAVSDAEWRGLFAAMGMPELADDERFSNPMSRMANVGELIGLMRAAAEATTLGEFEQLAEQHDVPASRINTIAELPTNPQVLNNAVFVERTHATAGTLREPRPAPRFSATPARVAALAPLYGEHTDAIVAELGLDATQLRAAGTVA
jgi:crotonobetainyl-CoA:carnitine CoA-transferase CaiB-like acyl-CoA transferase